MSEEIAKAKKLLAKLYYTEQELADELGKKIITLRVWRIQRKGPPFTRNGRQILYNRDRVLQWLNSQERVFPLQPAE